MRKGLLAYNGVLVGSGIANFLAFDYGWIIAVMVSIFSGPATLLIYLYVAGVISPTASPLLIPFNVVMLFMLLSAMLWDSTVVQVEQQEGKNPQTFELFHALFNGVSGMFLVRNVFSGVIIVMGMMLCSRILAGAVLMGSLFGAIGSWALFDTSMNSINDGVAGFNVALTFAALHHYFVPSIKSTLFVGLFGVIWTLVVQTAVSVLFSTL